MSRRIDPRIERALDVIGKRYADPLSAREVAHLVGFGRWSFSRRFREETGVTFTSYLIGFRLLRVKVLLRDSRLNVGDVSAQVGITDPDYLARLFRRAEGRTPSEWRREQLWLPSSPWGTA